MTIQPTVTKTLRIPWTLHQEALKRLQPGESFTAYVNRLIQNDVLPRAETFGNGPVLAADIKK